MNFFLILFTFPLVSSLTHELSFYTTFQSKEFAPFSSCYRWWSTPAVVFHPFRLYFSLTFLVCLICWVWSWLWMKRTRKQTFRPGSLCYFSFCLPRFSYSSVFHVHALTHWGCKFDHSCFSSEIISLTIRPLPYHGWVQFRSFAFHIHFFVLLILSIIRILFVMCFSPISWIYRSWTCWMRVVNEIRIPQNLFTNWAWLQQT